MKFRTGLSQRKVFKNEKMEFDEGGFLLTQSIFVPMKKRQNNESNSEIPIYNEYTHH